MKANDLNQIPALEIASQIEEVTKDRVLLEREIDLYFEKLFPLFAAMYAMMSIQFMG